MPEQINTYKDTGVDNEQDNLKNVMRGIVPGCELAGCRLAGGETAGMPGLSRPGDLDLADFASGIAGKKQLLPKLAALSAGDLIPGLPSTGINRNSSDGIELKKYKMRMAAIAYLRQTCYTARNIKALKSGSTPKHRQLDNDKKRRIN